MKTIGLTPLKAVVAFVALFQLFTLNSVFLNGDEAIYLLLGEELRNFFATGRVNLHPLVNYLGPLDMWLMGSLYWIVGKFSSGIAGPWLVRVIPWTVFWGGLIVLYRETRRWSEKFSDAVLFLGAISPLPLVYARSGFPHSLLLGLFCVLVAEVFRLLRTDRVRWWVLGAVAGAGTEFHTTAFLGFLVVLASVGDRIWAHFKKEPWRALGSAALFLLLAMPEILSFPPPVGGAPGGSIFLELRNFINVLSGTQPYVWLLRTDFGQLVFPLVYLALLLTALGFQAKQLFAREAGVFLEDSALSRVLRRIWLATFAGTAFMFVMCFRGRSLLYVGHERYLLILVPGWFTLQADAFLRLAKRVGGAWNGSWLWAALFLLSFGRFAAIVTKFSFETQPSLRAAQWLIQNCPKDRCLAYGENFWNYWAIRYYTRDAIDLNYITDNWKQPAQHAQGNRELATCLFADSSFYYPGPYRAKIDFPFEAAGPAQTCYLGVDLRLLRTKP